ncbi:hypothetical protein ACFE04_024147 [Oxalis oulophora]
METTTTSVRMVEEEREMDMDVEETIFVAVGNNVDDNRNTLLWTAKNFTASKICMLHVHQPSHLLSFAHKYLGLSKFKQRAVNSIQTIERQNIHNLLNDCLSLLAQQGVEVLDKVWLEMDSVEKGIIGTPWFDGTEGVTQCPIQSGDTFIYKFVVDRAGTYLYHAHYGMQRESGLYGSIRVALPDGESEPFAYDYDKSIILNDWYHRSPYEQAALLSSIPFQWVGEHQSLLIQGKGKFDCSVLDASSLNSGASYINLGAYYLVGILCAILFGFVLHLGGRGLWLGIICALFVQVATLFIVFIRTNWQQERSSSSSRRRFCWIF